ncbi:protein-associating with the carboxyl-terminal domain of ezrin-like, partial [Plakobranchus ocellatus]
VLRGIRHPNIIRYIDGGEARGDVWLATECVKPLITSKADLTPDEICAGLHDLLQAIDFLHSMLGMCHNNLCISSLFLGHDGTWKLGELQHACKFSDATQTFLDQCRAFRKEDCLAPEEKAGTVKLSPGTGHARDMFAFGVIVDSLLEDIKGKDDRLKELERQASGCLSPDPTIRPTAASLLKLPFLRSDLSEIINFLTNVTMKSEAEKKDFFRNVVSKLRKLPEMVLARRLVIPLLARFVLLNKWADSEVIPHLLVPKTGTNPHGLLCEALFQEFVIPQLCNIFHVHDSHIRLILLEYFSHYVHLFSRQQLDDDIFLQILLGVRDSDDRIVAASFRALADLVPIMGGDVVVGGARKPFFFHGLPKQVMPEEMTRLSTPQNVTTLLASHKPLLKDLAAGSASALIKKEKSVEEKDRKAKEREQRREEAKLKREERRKRMKEKQMDKETEVIKKEFEFQQSTLIIEEVAKLKAKDSGQVLDNDALEDDLKADLNSVNHKPEQMDKNNCNDKDGVEKDRPNWSDLEDADQRIEEEIEEELRQMSDESVSDEVKIQTSPSPYRRQSPPASPHRSLANWDYDIPEAERDLGKLDLVPSATEKDTAIVNSIRSLDNTQALASSKTSKSLKLTKPVSSSSAAATKTEIPTEKSSANRKANSKGRPISSQPAKNDDLGAGLDIKTVEIKVKTEPELDFFADMTPSIQLGSVQSQAGKQEETKAVSGAEPVINTKLFAVNTPQEEGGHDTPGWGDDDWETEEF